MKHLSEYISEAIQSNRINLPYTFDIYNKGSKNVEFSITIKTIYNVCRKSGFLSGSIKLPLPADMIEYEVMPTKNTNSPQITDTTTAYTYWGKKGESNEYQTYINRWWLWLNNIFRNRKGKLSVTIMAENNNELSLRVNDSEFNKERDTKIKLLNDKDYINNFIDNVEERERLKKEAEKQRIENERKSKEAHDKWWKSLSDEEKLSYNMGYGRGLYNGD